MNKRIPLEEAALRVCEENACPPLIFQVPPLEGRKRLNRVQDAPVFQYPASVSVVDVNTGKWGVVRVYVVRPADCPPNPAPILYLHGGGWVFGNFHTHEKLVRELAARTSCVVLFPEYALSPEAKYPVAAEQCYQVLTMLQRISDKMNLRLNLSLLTVAGDSAGGNLAAVLTILSKFRHGPQIRNQLLYYPVTNACFNTGTYLEFASDYYLYRAGMMWFWNQYTRNESERAQITASPLRATLEQLRGLPETLILCGEADVLREEGEAYAAKLLCAGVGVTAVRIKATIHDFVMLNALDQTNACRAAMDLSAEWISRRNKKE